MLNSLTVRRVISAMPKGGMRATKLLSAISPKNGVFRLAHAPDVRMSFDTADIFQAQMAFGQYQPRLMKKIRQLAQSGDRVLIAGAHIGYVPLTVARLGCEVIACEADPRNAEKCVYNVGLNPHLSIKLVKCGLSDVDGRIPIWLSDIGSNSSFAVAHSAVSSTDVEVRQGDGVLSELSTLEIDGLVLDVEGWEVRALLGLMKTLKRRRPRWAVIECADWALRGAGTSEADLRTTISDLGWRISEEIGNDLICSS